MIKKILAASLLVGLTACSSEPPLTPEQQFLKAVHAGLDAKISGKAQIFDDKMISAGQAVCGIIPWPGATHSLIVAKAAEGVMKWSISDPYGSTDVIVTAAERYLCPTVHYAPTGVKE